MTIDQKLKELRALCDNASSGPWTVHGTLYNYVSAPGVSDREHVCTCGEMSANAHFIAEARFAMPLLIEVIERQREVLKTAEKALADALNQE